MTEKSMGVYLHAHAAAFKALKAFREVAQKVASGELRSEDTKALAEEIRVVGGFIAEWVHRGLPDLDEGDNFHPTAVTFMEKMKVEILAMDQDIEQYLQGHSEGLEFKGVKFSEASRAAAKAWLDAGFPIYENEGDLSTRMRRSRND
jgi:hypothetical protein